MKPKFQPSPSRTSASEKCRSVTPAQPHHPGGGEDHQARGDHPLDAEAGDQRAGEEGRREHRQRHGPRPRWPHAAVAKPQPTMASGVEVITRFISA